MEREELRKMILEQELARTGYDFTTLTVRFAASPEDDERPEAVWRFEGVAGSADEIAADVLSDIAMASNNDYPPPFELDEKRNVFSWGADGASWYAVLTVGSFAASTASLAYPIVRDRLAARGAAENASSEHTDEEALEYARWFLSSTIGENSEEVVAPDEFTVVAEKHAGSRHSFAFGLGDVTYTVELDAVSGHPLLIGLARRPRDTP